MKLSTKGRYGLRAMIDLARYSEKEPVSIGSVAARQEISERYLEQLVALLKKAGLVKSIRGASGGYVLAKKPSEISVGDILRALEGSLEPVKCAAFDTTTGEGCMASDGCVTKYVWQKINDSINDTVNQIMLDELIQESKSINPDGECENPKCSQQSADKNSDKQKHYRIYKENGGDKMSKLLYLDNAATTKTAPEVVEAMLPYFTEKFGNPSSVYSFAAANKEVINQQRDAIAEMIGAKSNEIYFTGGGSESDNWALKCTAEAYANKGNHIITTKIEHHAILHTAEYLEKRGFEVTYLDVDEDGKVKLDDLKAAIRPTTILISVMFANNEIGTIQPIKEIGEIAHEHGILFHTDAVQAFGQLPINVDECHIDMLSASGHKFNGPKGIGIMYIRTGVKIRSFIHGGAQERKRRAGTENVPGIVGIGTAAKRAAANMEERTAKEREVRDYLIDRVLNEIPYCRLNGHRTDRLPNNANFSFQFVEGESLLIKLDMKGICGSSGSACTSGSLDPSHVLLAIGLPHEIAHGSLRLTLNEEIEKEDIDYVVDNLKEIVAHLREMSPLYEDFIKKQKKQGEK